MVACVYRYVFPAAAPIEEIESSLLLAIWAAESLHGSTQVRLDASHLFDGDRRTCVIEAHTPVGQDLNRLFAGFIAREFGDQAFRVERLESPPNPTSA